MKRLIGRMDTDEVVQASKALPFLVQTLGIGVRPFIAALVNNMWRSTTPEEVLAIFLLELKALVEMHLKHPVRNAVLTIPVAFSWFQQTRIERACAMAGLHVLRLMPEPTAVALLYAQQQQQLLHDNMGSGIEKIALVNNMWRSTTPEEVLAIFLLELKALVEMHLKHPVRNAVLTIPVAFSRFQQTRIERACAMAGLHVLRLMPEPTAVALLYAQQQQQLLHDNMGSGIEKIALVFNIGAGYCDVAVSATAGGVSQIRALAGCTVGGEDILQNVMRHLLPDYDSLLYANAGQTMDRIKSMGLLRIATQDAIHKLATQESIEINVDLGNGLKVSKLLSRAEFEQVTLNIFEKCERIMKQCLADAKLAPEDIDDVILVGGCSRIPKIRSLVLGLCKKEGSYESIDVLEAAVSGAALEGAIASGATDTSGSLVDLLTIQATPMNLGIRADGDGFAAIIPRNTAVPARREMLFTTTRDNQTEALVAVYEGEDNQAEANHLLGYLKISGIPAGAKGSVEISVCMDIDAANVLRVFAGVVKPQGRGRSAVHGGEDAHAGRWARLVRAGAGQDVWQRPRPGCSPP